MTGEQIRKQIESNSRWNGTLIGFENVVHEVDFFCSQNRYFSIYKKGDDMCYDNMLTTLEFTSIESLVAFMQGALYHYNHPTKKN